MIIADYLSRVHPLPGETIELDQTVHSVNIAEQDEMQQATSSERNNNKRMATRGKTCTKTD